MKTAIALVERGLVPDQVTRIGIRRLLAQRLQEEERDTVAREAYLEELVAELASGPIALHTDLANEQHYELPPAFFQQVLGRYLKYSACYWPEGVNDLDEAEAAMLALTCERADLADGQNILELGCGWGSLTLWMAEHYPQARITAVSNATAQGQFILAEAERRGLGNVQVITADMNDFTTEQRFDRVVSVEMFEHMHNYRELMARISRWLNPGGCLFVHIFAHRLLAYPFTTGSVDEDDWMARYFFTGGLMPSSDLLLQCQGDLQLVEHWWLNGTHYQRTCEAWLHNQDRERDAIMALFRPVYGAAAGRWFQRWRVFFMACAELFGYGQGEEWGVCHYRFYRPM